MAENATNDVSETAADNLTPNARHHLQLRLYHIIENITNATPDNTIRNTS
jgi:hypothetical protein